MIESKKLQYLSSVGDVDFYRYKAKLFNYFYTPMAYYEKLLSRTIRETYDFIRGNYRVIYMACGDKLVGYGIVTRGGARNRFCTMKDIVLCSLWVQPEFRGRGYGNLLVEFLSTGLDIKYENVYQYIRHNNVQSIKAAEKNGYVKVGNASKKDKGLKYIWMNETGGLGIYKKQRGSENE